MVTRAVVVRRFVHRSRRDPRHLLPSVLRADRGSGLAWSGVADNRPCASLLPGVLRADRVSGLTRTGVADNRPINIYGSSILNLYLAYTWDS